MKNILMSGDVVVCRFTVGSQNHSVTRLLMIPTMKWHNKHINYLVHVSTTVTLE